MAGSFIYGDLRMSSTSFICQSHMHYSPQLDGLRGVAILFVMLFHADLPGFSGGFLGVDIFFVLSGFLITTLLVEEYESYGSVVLKNFYVRRLLRLVPALLLMLVAFCVYSFVFLDAAMAQRNVVDALIALGYLSNWARAFSLHPPDFLGHTWSLSVEEQFYLFWPPLLLSMFALLKNRKTVFAATVAFALSSSLLRLSLFFAGATVERLYNGLDTRADALMVGCALGLFLTPELTEKIAMGRFKKQISFAALFSALALVVLVGYADWRSPSMYFIGFLAVAMFTLSVIFEIVTHKKGAFARFLSTRVFVWIGSISYGLYLWHHPIFCILRSLGWSQFMIAFVGLLITFIIAQLSSSFLEKPILSLKRFFVRKKIV